MPSVYIDLVSNLPLNDNICELGVVPAVAGPDDAPQLDILAELYLAPALDPGREQLGARQLPEHPDLRLELVAAAGEDRRGFLLNPGIMNGIM